MSTIIPLMLLISLYFYVIADILGSLLILALSLLLLINQVKKEIVGPVPNGYFPRFCDIPFEELARLGKRTLILDLDLTIRDTGLIESCVRRIESGVQNGSIKDILIWTDAGCRGEEDSNDAYKSSFELSGRLKKNVLLLCNRDHSLKKPDPVCLYQAIKMLGAEKSEVVVIGDQLFKDILAAETVGAMSILVDQQSRSWPLGFAAKLLIYGLNLSELRRYSLPTGLYAEQITGSGVY